jgi:8-oxo-dGTP pyrophosphatase MutT (NUDIX family)
VGGVVISEGRALLIRRGSAPLQGEWSIPGGLLEVGETLEQGVARELAEETGLEVRVIELIEVFERIFPAPPKPDGTRRVPPHARDVSSMPPGAPADRRAWKPDFGDRRQRGAASSSREVSFGQDPARCPVL